MDSLEGNYDVIVIGGGPIGLSTAYHLSKRNTRTLVLEQFTFFNQLGSSAGVSRQFRMPYPEEYMVKLVKQHRKARMGRNPATGEAIKIPAKTVVKARIAKQLKDTVLPRK